MLYLKAQKKLAHLQNDLLKYLGHYKVAPITKWTLKVFKSLLGRPFRLNDLLKYLDHYVVARTLS